ncbi:hypothetical protein Salat_2969700 [Sesamum alatum]|uniref:Uncharacterized protein n=1 Tax=Sesamum alatum TaxID=300844 RepID=A0AAE2C7T4_9LAMI|nr:hypothetical protein Salat_2969700 [Sesamum alatum]
MDGEIGFRVFNDFRTAYRDNERSGELLLYLLSNDRGNGRKDALGNRPKRKFSWDMASGRGAIRAIGFVSHPVLSSATSFEESEDESACIRSCDSFPRSKRRASGFGIPPASCFRSQWMDLLVGGVSYRQWKPRP